MDRATSQGIAVGLLGGAVGLFVLQLAPMLRDPTLRFAADVVDDQSTADALVTSVIGFTLLGVVLHYTGDVVCETWRTGRLPPEVL